MTAVFPTEEWLKGLETKLNSDAKYADIARNWEGDLFFVIRSRKATSRNNSRSIWTCGMAPAEK